MSNSVWRKVIVRNTLREEFEAEKAKMAANLAFISSQLAAAKAKADALDARLKAIGA